MRLKPKKKGLGLEMATFQGKSGTNYLVFRTQRGSFHVFGEVNPRQAARDCGAKTRLRTTRQVWKRLWASQ